MNKLLLILLALQMTGCATARTLDAAKPGAPVVYSGTRLDLYAMNGGCCAEGSFRRRGAGLSGLDLPASALLDTLLLPLSVADGDWCEFSGDWRIVGEAHNPLWRGSCPAPAQQSQTPLKFI
jgi:uncharacterized protein YceK